MMPLVLIAGVSVRGMTESAVRAGYTVVDIDAYADTDLAEIAETRLVSPYTAHSAAAAARDVPRTSQQARVPAVGVAPVRHDRGDRGDRVAVCYVSNFENHPDALRQLASGRLLWGNSPATLAAARTPPGWAKALADAGIAVPRLRTTAPRPTMSDVVVRWLLKPRSSGGGHGILPWNPGMPVPRRCVLQERIAGPAGSIAFAADGRQSIPIAMTRQLIGERALGAQPFRYCGNILTPADDPTWGADTPLGRAAAAIAQTATSAFGLVGVNGIDFIARRGRPVPIEINPRFTAAMELPERRDNISIFAAHVAGCSDALATFSPLTRPFRGSGAVGKAIVFARRALTVGPAVREWLADPNVRDIPRPDTHIPSGAPICSIFAAARTSAECHAQLLRRAERIYDAVETTDWRMMSRR
jgi:predicted ATP-grasp superfamily ATP-dependent carboligase